MKTILIVSLFVCFLGSPKYGNAQSDMKARLECTCGFLDNNKVPRPIGKVKIETSPDMSDDLIYSELTKRCARKFKGQNVLPLGCEVDNSVKSTARPYGKPYPSEDQILESDRRAYEEMVNRNCPKWTEDIGCVRVRTFERRDPSKRDDW